MPSSFVKIHLLKQKLLIVLFVALSLAYVVLVLTLPTDPSVLTRYSISNSQARLLNLTVVIPLVTIWFVAFYGFIRFKLYALLVKHSPEGMPLRLLASGLMILAFSLPINSILSTVLGYVVIHNSHLLPETTIIRNYVALVLAFLALLQIARGAKLLQPTIKQLEHYRPLFSRGNNIFLILFCALFTWLTTSQPLARGVAPSNAYYLPDWLLVLTLIVPYVYIWHRGLIASARLNSYTRHVKGAVYRQAFKYLSMGIASIILISILIQIIVTLSARLNRLNLTPLLLIIYVLLAFYAVGFGLVARGAKKLKRIEEA